MNYLVGNLFKDSEKKPKKRTKTYTQDSIRECAMGKRTPAEHLLSGSAAVLWDSKRIKQNITQP